MAVAREWPINLSPWQQIHKHNRGTLGRGVFCLVCPEATYLELPANCGLGVKNVKTVAAM